MGLFGHNINRLEVRGRTEKQRGTWKPLGFRDKKSPQIVAGGGGARKELGPQSLTGPPKSLIDQRG